ncbi:RnfH family protein [Rheinheimera sp.]|uniref:RnfH family protein n=1 Tax=Rheinheimera sp. TaxID=1869214 RepID=UPI00307EB5C0
MREQIAVEVAFATPEKQSLLSVSVAADATVQQVIESSGMLRLHPEIDLGQNKVGVWSRTCKLTDRVKAGDRIEIYRPLIADPKDMRRRRAEKAKEEGRADKVTGGRPHTSAEPSTE